jgi:hypothetical protein
MTQELFDKELKKLSSFIKIISKYKSVEELKLKKGSTTAAQKSEIIENVQTMAQLLQNLQIMAGLVLGVQQVDDEEQKKVVYSNTKKMLKEMKEIIESN